MMRIGPVTVGKTVDSVIGAAHPERKKSRARHPRREEWPARPMARIVTTIAMDAKEKPRWGAAREFPCQWGVTRGGYAWRDINEISPCHSLAMLTIAFPATQRQPGACLGPAAHFQFVGNA